MKDKMTRWLIPQVGEGLLTSEGEFGDGSAGWANRRFIASKLNGTPP
jgi:hypothetical protein